MKKIFVLCIVIFFLLPFPVNAETNQNVRISNISSSSVVISWVADEKCIGTVHYGNTSDNLDLTETDSAQRENCVITVEIKGLTPNTTYYFEIMSGDVLDNNNGMYYTFKTTEIAEGISMPSSVLYGQILLDNGENADGTMVYVTVEHDNVNSTPLSCMVFEGYWVIELSDLKHENGTGFTECEINDTLYIGIEGGKYGYKNITTVITGEDYQNCTTPKLKAWPELEISEAKANIEGYNRVLIVVFCIVVCLVAVMVYLVRREQK